MASDDRIDIIKSAITDYPDWPKKGVVFKDMFSVYADQRAFSALMSLLRDKGSSLRGHIDVVVGLDARGFLIGPEVAAKAGVPFVPVRKAGKLPGDCVKRSYSLEYGEATVEMQTEPWKKMLDNSKTAIRVAIVDDLLATGGTMRAAIDLVKSACGDGRARVVECFLLLELDFLKGAEKLKPEAERVEALIHVDGE